MYNTVTGSTTNQTQRSAEPEPFKPIELEQAFNGVYRSFRVNGRPKIDVNTFFNRIRKGLIELIKRELKTRTSARIQTTAWIRFVRDDEEGQERVELAFNSLMMSVYQGSDLDQIVDGMIANMKFQIENSALLNSRFVFDEVLYLDINFHQLNLMRGSSYLPLPDFIAKRKAMINPQNGDEECFFNGQLSQRINGWTLIPILRECQILGSSLIIIVWVRVSSSAKTNWKV